MDKMSHNEYFYGPEKGEGITVVAESEKEPDVTLLSQESPIELKKRIKALEIQIRLDIENEKKKKSMINSLYQVEEDALPPEVKDAEKIHQKHEDELRALKAALSDKKEEVPTWRKRLRKAAAFFSF